VIRATLLAASLATPALADPTYAPCTQPATDAEGVTRAFVSAGWTPATGDAAQPLSDRITLASYLMLLYPDEPTTRAELDRLTADARDWGGSLEGPDNLLFARGDDAALAVILPKGDGIATVCTFVGPALPEVADAVATLTPDFTSNGLALYNLAQVSPDVVWSALRYKPSFDAPETVLVRDTLLVSYNDAGAP
jgi:hypothetical protein